MAEILLLNPKGRKMAKTRRSAAQKRATAKLIAFNRGKSRRKPTRRGAATLRVMRRAAARSKRRVGATVVTLSNNPRRRRRNPIVSRVTRRMRSRRSNPINLGGMRGILGPIKEGMIQGAGAVAFDVAYGYVTPYLPASLQPTPGNYLGMAAKAVITVVAARALSKATKGYSNKAAVGALTIQARDLVASMLPGGTVNGLGYSVSNRVVRWNPRINPNQTRLNQFTRPGVTPLLSQFTRPGVTPLLSGTVADREGVRFR